jgi:hypothetical protein
MILPIVYPIRLFGGDDYDLELNWRERNGPTYLLADYDARMRLFVSQSDRTLVYTINNPITSSEGIDLDDTIPNIHAHILGTHIAFTPAPGFYIFELRPPSPSPPPIVTPGWIRILEGPVEYEA